MLMLTCLSLCSPVTKTSKNKNDGLVNIVRNSAGTAGYAVPAILTFVTGGGKPAVICRFSCNSHIRTWNIVSLFYQEMQQHKACHFLHCSCILSSTGLILQEVPLFHNISLGTFHLNHACHRASSGTGALH